MWWLSTCFPALDSVHPDHFRRFSTLISPRLSRAFYLMTHHDLTDSPHCRGYLPTVQLSWRNFENQIKLLGMAYGEWPNVWSIPQKHECPLKVWRVIELGIPHKIQFPYLCKYGASSQLSNSGSHISTFFQASSRTPCPFSTYPPSLRLEIPLNQEAPMTTSVTGWSG